MRSLCVSRRALAALAVPAIVGVALLTPVVAEPAVAAVAAESAVADDLASAACTVTAAELTWGFKESFRSYISGSIAKGSWEVEDGATYETPAFGWPDGTGDYDLATATGEIAFAGGIQFSGHGGLLQTRVANPTLVFAGPGSAQLLLDISGVAMEDALAGDEAVEEFDQVPFVEIDLSDAVTAAADGTVTLTATDAPTTITEDGFAAFGNYEPGTAFDPITITVSGECADPEPEPEAGTAPDEEPVATPTQTALADASADGDADDAGTIALIAGGVAAVVAALVVVFVVRRRRAASTGAASTGGAPTEGASTVGAPTEGAPTEAAPTEDGSTPGVEQ